MTNNAELAGKSVAELFAYAVDSKKDEDQHWDAIWALRDIASQEVFQTAVAFCKSENPLKRQRGLEVLAQLGVSMKDHVGPFFEERLSVALEYLHDPSEKVTAAAAWALRHMNDDRAKAALLKVQSHPFIDVRHAVAAGLGGVNKDEAVNALISLMNDTEAIVREWATFSLAINPNLDTAHIRDALRCQLNDIDADVRKEAIAGLALRKDAAGIKALLGKLGIEEFWASGLAAEILDVPNETPLAELADGLNRLLMKQELNAEK